MQPNEIVSRGDWIAARRKHLAEEKEFTRLRDQLSEHRRQLPWVRVDEDYVFQGASGKTSLSELFAGRSQLIIYHFMFGPSWDEGCPRCSLISDHFDGAIIHLNQRDVTMVVVSRAPIEKLEDFRRRMGWKFKWLSSLGSGFNHDYHVSFADKGSDDEQVYYNYKMMSYPSDEAHGISVFYKDGQGNIYHTYSSYGRGLDMLIGAYNILDLAPKGRDEADLSFTMSWVRRHDQYGDQA